MRIREEADPRGFPDIIKMRVSFQIDVLKFTGTTFQGNNIKVCMMMRYLIRQSLLIDTYKHSTLLTSEMKQ